MAFRSAWLGRSRAPRSEQRPKPARAESFRARASLARVRLVAEAAERRCRARQLLRNAIGVADQKDDDPLPGAAPALDALGELGAGQGVARHLEGDHQRITR